VNKNRYGGDFVARSRSFEPFTAFARDLLAGAERDSFVLRDVPDEAVIFRHRSYLIVSVELLEKAWKGG
jgi:hypothetical protein